MDFSTLFKIDALSGFVSIAICVFSLLTLLFSFKAMQGKKGLGKYYFWVTLSALAGVGTALANHLVVLLILWGILGLTLYLLINFGTDKAGQVAKKTFIIVGGSDALMLLGIAIIYYLSGTYRMDFIRLDLQGPLVVSAYLCVAIACFAKAGLMPFHSWIPDCAKEAPVSVVAFLPASLDKLLGIYLLARLSLNLFVMNTAMNILLMLMGAFTIIAAVMMALVQHDMKKLLGFHAVSQVGYMVLGIGTGNPIGIAGGLFHMLNNAIYKSCLFFTSGNVEHRAKTTELSELGGLAKVMPLTYICALVASLSISGIPPFNGFFSKWMIYQGLINNLQLTAYSLKLTAAICLIAAMFGSGLTLASFVKLLHATYLGQRTDEKKVTEVAWQMWLPALILAVACVIFGVFALPIPLKNFIFPAVGSVNFSGVWFSGLTTLLIVIALALGFFLVKLQSLRPQVRQDAAFIGGEPMDLNLNRPTGTEFYNTVKEFGILPWVYKRAEAGAFDLYEQGKNFVFAIGRFLQYLHNGVLPTYLVWTLLGMIVLFLVLVK